jgi:hypothetical protein
MLDWQPVALMLSLSKHELAQLPERLILRQAQDEVNCERDAQFEPPPHRR